MTLRMDKHIRLDADQLLIESSREHGEDISPSTAKQACKPPDASLAATSGVPCWTCRRRRVQCDRTRPTCTKCHDSGRECLGYKKPLVWNKGIASRGKMMGKDFDEASTAHDQEAKKAQKLEKPPPGTSWEVNGYSDHLNETMHTALIKPEHQDMQVSKVLVDPIFQGFGPVTRYYLDYYTKVLCGQAVLYDTPGNNPFRGLLAMIGNSPLILNSILAMSASHATNNLYPPSFFPGTLISQGVCFDREIQPVSNPSLYHALSYKQKALAQLRKDIQDPSGLNRDLIVATIALFVWIEVLESGKDTWRIHLDWVRKLTLAEDGSDADEDLSVARRSQKPSTPLIHSYFFDMCTICDIIGTTLTQPYKISEPIFPSVMSLGYLKRSEEMSFIGCPADLLYIILLVNWHCWSQAHATSAATSPHHSPLLSSVSNTQLSTTTPSTLNANSILNEILLFDPISWSLETSTTAPYADFSQRTYLASAFKSAVLIYATRGLRSDPAHNPLTISQIASQIIIDVSMIPIHDPHFKCILWPAFISGAETRVPAERDIVRDLFKNLWLELRSENIVNASRVLERIWTRADREEWEVDGEDYRGGWIDHLMSEGADWLFL